MDDETVTRAVVVWTGWGSHSSPDRQDERLITTFGESLKMT